MANIVLMEIKTSLNGRNLNVDLPEIVVAARMMRKTEIKPRVRVLVNLSSLSEILRSALVQQYFWSEEPQQNTLTAVSSVSGQ